MAAEKRHADYAWSTADWQTQQNVDDQARLCCAIGDLPTGAGKAMAYQTFRVEITRDETRDDGPVGIEITAYIDRMPETNEAPVGRLSRAWRGVWNSRLQYTGDFDTLAEALSAIMAAYPEADRVRCYEYSVDDEFAREVAPLIRSEEKWLPGS
jgi:hypothetical protein